MLYRWWVGLFLSYPATNYYTSIELWSYAVDQCKITEWVDSLLCRLMGVKYPRYPPHPSDYVEFRSNLLDGNQTFCGKLGTPGRQRLFAIGIAYRRHKYGLSSEAIRADTWADVAFELLHM